jgi:hypothetical protein
LSYRFRNLILISAILFPAVVGLFRDNILQAVAKYMGVIPMQASMLLDRDCNKSKICRRVYEISLPDRDSSLVYAVGYHSAFAESQISLDLESNEKHSLNMNWFEFVTRTIGPELEGTRSVFLESFAHDGSKKLGLESNYVLFGSRQQINALEFIFKLFNVHLYLVLGFFAFAVGLIVSVSTSMDRQSIDISPSITGLLILVTMLCFSHTLDQILTLFSIPPSVIQTTPRILWGSLVIYLTFANNSLRPKESKSALALIGIYILVMFPSFFPGWGASVLNGWYRWYVATITFMAICIAPFLTDRKLVIAFGSLLVVDSLVLHQIISLSSGLYLSPLGLTGLFVYRNRHTFFKTLAAQKTWVKTAQLRSRLANLRTAHLDGTPGGMDAFMSAAIQCAAAVIGSKRAAIFIQKSSGPVIHSFSNGSVRQIADNQTPPLFARILQTNMEYWWINSKEIGNILGKRVRDSNPYYESDTAIVIPIALDKDIYGILSFTDIYGVKDGKKDKIFCDNIEILIRSFATLVAADLVKEKERNLSLGESLSKSITDKFIEHGLSANSVIEVARSFLSAIDQHFNFKMMYFSLDHVSRALKPIASSNLSDEHFKQWQAIPFKARVDNLISPFAVAANEQNVVFIPKIDQFYNLLEENSVSVLNAANTDALLVIPVIFSDQVLGLLCIMDGGDQVDRETKFFVEKPVVHFGFKIYECSVTNTAERQRLLLQKFVEPELADSLANAGSAPFPLGTVVTSVLIAQDLRGSTGGSHETPDPGEYAKKLHQFYQAAETVGGEIGLKLEITVGDSLIYLADRRSQYVDIFFPKLLARLHKETAKNAKNTMAVERVLTVFHFGKVFKGLFSPKQRLRWDITGADLNDLFKIESAAKTVPDGCLALSENFISELRHTWRESILNKPHTVIEVGPAKIKILVFNAEETYYMSEEFELELNKIGKVS